MRSPDELQLDDVVGSSGLGRTCTLGGRGDGPVEVARLLVGRAK